MKRFIYGGIVWCCVLHLLYVPKLAASQDILLQDMEPEISMDFKNAGLTDILKAFSIQSGLNFIASGEVKDRKITLYLDKVPLEKAMVRLFSANNLAYELDRDANIFIVKDLGEPQREMITRVFRLRYATVSTSSIKEEMKDKVVGKAAELKEGGGGGTQDSGESGKWTAEENAGITQAVKNVLTKQPNGEPIGSVIEDFRTNSLIVTDTPAGMKVIAQLIASLDRPIAQVMLEVEMLDVSKDVVDELGFDWADAGSYAMQIVSASKSVGFPFDSLRDTFSDDGKTGGTLSFPTTLKLVLDFLRTRTDTKDLARPRILTLDNETAEIRIQTEEVIALKYTYDDAGNIQESTPLTDDTGVSLRVTPQINLETGEITLFVVPVVRESSDSSFIDPVSLAPFKDIEERSTRSIIKLNDGDTVILGGLIRTKYSLIERKVPLLGDIPLLGALFRHKNKTQDLERELLVFITPHIVKENGVSLASQARDIALPEREQSTVSGVNRQVMINSSLNNLEQAN